MSNRIPVSQFVGRKITVRTALPHLPFACNGGMTEFFNCIMPQEDGQSALDRELFLSKTANVMRYDNWLLERLNLLVCDDEWQQEFDSLPLQKDDPLYKLSILVPNSIGNVVQPETVDYTNAKDFLVFNNENMYKFIKQFTLCEIDGFRFHAPRFGTISCICDSSDVGVFRILEETYHFTDFNSKTKVATFMHNKKRHNVAKFFVKKFFEARNKLLSQAGVQ